MAKPDNAEEPKLNDAFIVRRSLRVPQMRDKAAVDIVQACLSELDGMVTVNIKLNRARLKLSYDASKINFGNVLKKLEGAGYPMANDWWSGFKTSWYRYLDENAQTNAKSKGGACCSNPSDIYANRRK